MHHVLGQDLETSQDPRRMEKRSRLVGRSALTCFASADSLPPVHIEHRANPFAIDDPSALDLQELVKRRFPHQTKQGATGVKNCSKSTTPINLSSHSPSDDNIYHEKTKQTERQKMLCHFAKQQGDRGIGSGLERSARWRNLTAGAGGGGTESTASAPATGNSKNAAESAKAAATKVFIIITELRAHL